MKLGKMAQKKSEVESEQGMQMAGKVEPKNETQVNLNESNENAQIDNQLKEFRAALNERDIKIAELETKLKEYLGDLQRTRADFENYRKQTELQKENAQNAAKLATVYKVLPMLDNLEKAIDAYEELAPLKKSLDKTLKELGLSRIDSTAEVEFNPNLHNAMMVEGDGEKESIAETLQTGYYYEGEVLRPALVKVKKS